MRRWFVVPQDKDFKRLVRARMSQTGERYTQAREGILARPELAEIPAPWFMAGDRPAEYEFGLLPDTISYSGSRVVRLRLREDVEAPGGFGTLMQSVRATRYLGQRVRFGAMIRTEEVTGWFGLWLRVDGPVGSIAFDNMQDRALRGTTYWTQAGIVLDVDEDARSIHFGMLLVGGGAADLCRASFEVVTGAVPVTTVDKLPDEPRALDFGVTPASG
jgi:hypothetical protein